MYACRHMCIVLGGDPLKPTCSQIGAFCICVVVSMVIDFRRGIFNKFHFTRNVFNDEKSQHIIMAICKNVLANLCLICTIYLDAFIQSSYAPGTVILRDGVIMGGPSFSKIKVLYNRWFHEEPLTSMESLKVLYSGKCVWRKGSFGNPKWLICVIKVKTPFWTRTNHHFIKCTFSFEFWLKITIFCR